jgi:hypothetical protein
MQKQSSREPDAAFSTVYVERLLSSCPDVTEEKAFSFAEKQNQSSN